MLSLIFYIPMAFAVAVLLGYTIRGIARGGDLFLPAGFFAAALGVSLFLMFGVDARWARWAAIGIVGMIVVPALAPIALMLISAALAKLGGKPIRWN